MTEDELQTLTHGRLASQLARQINPHVEEIFNGICQAAIQKLRTGDLSLEDAFKFWCRIDGIWLLQDELTNLREQAEAIDAQVTV